MKNKIIKMEKNKKSSYIFVFGNRGVGKTTIVASIGRVIKDSENLSLRTNPKDLNSMEGFAAIYKLINENMFPAPSKATVIKEIDIGISVIDKDILLALTFLEMSGEDLNKIDLSIFSQENHKTFRTTFDSHIKKSSLCMLVTDYENAKDDDFMLFSFLQILLNLESSVPILLIVSKWDLNSGNLDLEQFVDGNLRLTKGSLLDDFPTSKILPFSVGRTKMENGKALIEEFDLKYSQNLIEILFDLL